MAHTRRPRSIHPFRVPLPTLPLLPFSGHQAPRGPGTVLPPGPRRPHRIRTSYSRRPRRVSSVHKRHARR
ncbi:hypothetical protein ACFYSF_30500, partial [Streptomyces canus]|uniref:hypothetical protein n=1 Tax=Streptomyces canus TaxID=58343 RepID=UPI003678D6B4